MSDGMQPGSCCKSIFKGGGEAIDKRQFTRKWAELIRRMEKNSYLRLIPR